RQVETDREARLALLEVLAVALVRLAGVRVPGVGAHTPGAVGFREARFAHARNCMVRGGMTRLIDVMHLGRDRVIGAYDLDGVMIDPGPASTVETLLSQVEPRAPM